MVKRSAAMRGWHGQAQRRHAPACVVADRSVAMVYNLAATNYGETPTPRMSYVTSLRVKPTPPAVILDLDGTVADTLDDITNAINYALDCQMRELLDRDTVRGMIGDGLPTLMSRAGRTTEEDMVASLVRRFQEHYDDFDQLWDVILASGILPTASAGA